MSVKHALLGILSEKERHGYELKSAFDALRAAPLRLLGPLGTPATRT
jgi:DNA-binding PadR family transcriptional regulator